MLGRRLGPSRARSKVSLSASYGTCAFVLLPSGGAISAGQWYVFRPSSPHVHRSHGAVFIFHYLLLSQVFSYLLLSAHGTALMKNTTEPPSLDGRILAYSTAVVREISKLLLPPFFIPLVSRSKHLFCACVGYATISCSRSFKLFPAFRLMWVS